MKKNDAARNFGKLIKGIEKSNAKFASATKAQRIVMVAKDVLALLDLKRIKAKRGSYMQMPRISGMPLPKMSESGDCQLQDVLKMPALPSCSVCAIGGAMLASTLRLNDVSVSVSGMQSEYSGLRYFGYCEADEGGQAEDDMSERAREVFPEVLLRQMEHAFENGHHGYYRRRSITNRLKAIYQNLIDNKGKAFTQYRSKPSEGKVVWSLP